jgi:parallel beta-helix repeat protein
MVNHNTLEDDSSKVSFMYSLIDSALVRIQSIRGREALRTHHATLLACLLLAVVVLQLNIHPAFSSSTIYIRADGNIDPPSAPISTTNNMIYTLTNNIYDEIVVEKSDIVIDGASYTVQGNGTGNGFTLYSVTSVTLTNINIKNFAYGIYLESSSYNSIHRNNISGNDYDGIEVYSSSDFNNITENRIEANGWFGVGILYSHNNTITANDIANNDDGIDAYDASGTEISKNRITGSGEFGIGLYSSSENAIFLNNFVNNTQHVYSEYSTNRWDNGYPSGGNYWSDYIGTDTYSGPNQNQPGSDGIGDTPYNVGENNQDGYPLMQKWTNIAIAAISSSKTAVGQGQKVNITIIVQNQGWDAVTTSVTLYVNTTILSSFTNIALSGRTQTTLTYTWQTASFIKAKYVISANATAIPGETDNRDNTLVYNKTVAITITGDVNGDGAVDIYDAIVLANAYASVPTSSNWNGNADINSDNVVDIYDAIILANNYGKKI